MTKKPKIEPYPAVALNLRNARIAAGFETVSDAARFIGIPVPTAIAHEGKGTSFRRPKLEQLRKYAVAYHTTIDTLEGGEIISQPMPGARRTREIPAIDNLVAAPILGTAQAGSWLEVDPLAQVSDETVPTKPGSVPLFAVRVAGDSMNRIIQDGDVAIIKPWAALGRDPHVNEVLLVQRERDGRYEVTIKTFRDGQLWPESTNPKWRHPLSMKNGDTITILGLVSGLFRPL